MSDDAKKTILARRARFVAIAVAGLGAACEPKPPNPCLEPARMREPDRVAPPSRAEPPDGPGDAAADDAADAPADAGVDAQDSALPKDASVDAPLPKRGPRVCLTF